MSFLYLVPNGLNVPDQPEWGGWGGRLAHKTAPMEAVDVLRDDELAGQDLHRSLRQDDVAFEDLHLVDVVHADAVGFKVERLVAVGLFGVRERRDKRQEGEQCEHRDERLCRVD